jgi:cytochrome c-type biogenesis protein CcmE
MRLTPEQLQARKRRNLAIAGGLVVFIVLVFTITVLNLKRNIEDRAEAEAAGRTVEGVR